MEQENEFLQEEIKRPSVQVYTGPNVPRLSLLQYQVYKGGLPASVTLAAKEIPEIMDLIVPVNELEQARRDIARAGSYRNSLFNAVKKQAETRRKG